MSATDKSTARADRPRDLAPAALPRTGHKAPPTFARALTIAILYVAVFLIAGLVSGVDYDAISDSTPNVVGFVVIPVGLGILATLALSARWGWWPAIFHDEALLSRPRWARLIPVLIALSIAASLIAAPWRDWTVGLVLLILLGTLMVGFAEELVFRGYLLVGARARFTETGAWFVTSALFGLLHGLNVLTGQGAGATVRQIGAAFVIGSALYLVRRLTGMLAVCMALHGLWDFSTFIGAGRGEDVAGAPGAIAAVPFVACTMILTIAALVAVFRGGGRAAAAAG